MLMTRSSKPEKLRWGLQSGMVRTKKEMVRRLLHSGMNYIIKFKNRKIFKSKNKHRGEAALAVTLPDVKFIQNIY